MLETVKNYMAMYLPGEALNVIKVQLDQSNSIKEKDENIDIID